MGEGFHLISWTWILKWLQPFMLGEIKFTLVSVGVELDLVKKDLGPKGCMASLSQVVIPLREWGFKFRVADTYIL